MDEIKIIKMDNFYNAENILNHLLERWLSNTPEEVWLQQLCTALENIEKKDLASEVRKKYTDSHSEGMPIN